MRGTFGIVLPLLLLGLVGMFVLLDGRASPGPSREGRATSDGELSVGADWPMFHGNPALTGVAEEDLPDALALRWRFKTDAPVASSAAIHDGRVFVGSDDGNLYAIDLSSGEPLWTFPTDSAIEATPLVIDGGVFVGSSDGWLYALDAANGDLRWKYETGGKILGSANWGRAPGDTRLRILIGSYDNTLHCVDSATGEAIWTCETDSYINGAPAVADGKVIFGGCDAIVHILSLQDGSYAGQIETEAYIAGAPAIANGHAFIGNYVGEFLCADITTGEVVWRYPNEDAPCFSSPAVGPTGVAFGVRDRRVLYLDRMNGGVLWSFPTREDVDSSPAICGDKLVFGADDGRLYMVRLADGSEVWSYEIGDSITSSPAVASGMVVVGSHDGYVYAFGAGN